MAKTAMRAREAVYEDGVFRPLRRVAQPNQSRVRLTVAPVDGPPAQTERACDPAHGVRLGREVVVPSGCKENGMRAKRHERRGDPRRS